MSLRRAAVLGGAVVAGLAIGTASVWVHDRWWSLALAAAASLVTLWAAPRGLARVLYVACWLLPMALFTFARPEGDFVIAQDARGYTFLGLGAAVLMSGIATIPSPRRAAADRAVDNA